MACWMMSRPPDTVPATSTPSTHCVFPRLPPSEPRVPPFLPNGCGPTTRRQPVPLDTVWMAIRVEGEAAVLVLLNVEDRDQLLLREAVLRLSSLEELLDALAAVHDPLLARRPLGEHDGEELAVLEVLDY